MIESGRILPGKLLLKPIKEEEKQGLIFKPVDVMKVKTHAGEVVIVGDPLPTLDSKIQVADKVLHSPHSFVEVEIDGEQYRLLNIQDVLFIYK